jgi:hypothetical protein
MASITGTDELSGWAHRSLPAKNKLTGTDAQLVERAFESKLAHQEIEWMNLMGNVA